MNSKRLGLRKLRPYGIALLVALYLCAPKYAFASAVTISAPADGGGSLSGDLIQDFAGVDYLCINGASFGLGSPGGAVLETWRFVSGSGANLATTQFGYDSANGHVWYDVDGTGAGGQTVLATLQPGATLTNFDFLVF